MVAVDITPAKDGGVLKEIIKEGIGDDTPTTGSQVSVHYVGTLPDGSILDSSRQRNEPFKFTLDRGSVISAWNIGVATMKQGEIALFTCAPRYAYGETGSPPKVPPNTTLKFEIEVLHWTGEYVDEEKEGSIEKFIITKGTGSVIPHEGALLDIHLVGKYNNEIFEERDVKFCLGEGEDVDIVEGVETGLKSFVSGEKARLKIKSKHAFNKRGKPECNIPPNADVEYIVELKNFEAAVDHWSLKPQQKVEQAKLLKEKGTNHFKNDKLNLAIKLYKRIVELLSYEHDFDDDLKKERNGILLSTHLNLALCYLKSDQNVEAKASCIQALTLDPNNVKAVFRRGQAHLGLASPEIALKDFQEVLRIDPKNTAARKQIIICNNLIKKHLSKEKKLYANMFDKFAQEDRQ